VHGANPMPVRAGTFQRLLSELLRDVPVTGPEGQRAGELRVLGLEEARELLGHPPSLSRQVRIATPALALIRARPSGTHSTGFRFTSDVGLLQLILLSPSSQVGRRSETHQCII